MTRRWPGTHHQVLRFEEGRQGHIDDEGKCSSRHSRLRTLAWRLAQKHVECRCGLWYDRLAGKMWTRKDRDREEGQAGQPIFFHGIRRPQTVILPFVLIKCRPIVEPETTHCIGRYTLSPSLSELASISWRRSCHLRTSTSHLAPAAVVDPRS